MDVDLEAGTAHFYSGHECVPLKIDGKGQWLFLVQNTDFALEDGEWKVKKYKLTDARMVPNAEENW